MTCNANKIIQIKQGSSGTFVMQYTTTTEDNEGNEIDVPKSLIGYSILIDFVDPLTNKILFAASIGNGITLTQTIGQYIVDTGITTDWPLGSMPLDILYVYNNTHRHTDDWILEITKGRTRGVIQNG